jgi:two-component system chemotaxis response regulator CheY
VELAERVIMIADDAPQVRALCSAALDSQGYGVVEARDGVEAVARYREYRPDVVLMDLTMPAMDGLAALKAIRQLDPKARVVMVSAGTDSDVDEALRAGAQGAVLKPFSRNHILDAVETALAGGRVGSFHTHGWRRPSGRYGVLSPE